MRLLKEFYRNEGLNIGGKTISREAARAIIRQANQVLMVYSPVNKDYKFPGGGIKERESHEEALVREINEECGVMLTEVEDSFGFVVEYAKAREEIYDVYGQISYYYLCRVNPRFLGQNLDDYEQKLGFRPEWVNIDVALRKNQAVLSGKFGSIPRWTRRDTYVLEVLANRKTDCSCW